MEASPAPSERLLALDALRALALFAVLAVNLVTEFRVSLFAQFLPAAPMPARLDAVALDFVRHGLETKAISLFSLMFGIGLGLQWQARAQGRPAFWLSRRLLVLLALGAVHLVFIWNGDILVHYAIAGLLILPLLGRSPAMLLACAALMFGIQEFLVLPWFLQTLPDEASLRAQVALADAIYPACTWQACWEFSLAKFKLLSILHGVTLPRSMALFLLGAAVAKLRLLHTWRGGQWLMVGALAAVLGHSLEGRLLQAVGYAISFASLIFATVHYGPGRRLLAPCAALGRMAFTQYVMQSVLCSWLFFGYGLGWYGRMGPAAGLFLALCIWLGQLVLSHYWLRSWHSGPLEWLWRRLAYGPSLHSLK